MLTRLALRNVGLIAGNSVTLAAGFTTLTGETGAGKSMLIGGLSLCLGARADRDLIRHGADQATVEAVFDVAHRPDIVALVAEYGLSCDDGELVIRRVLTPEKSRAFICGGQISVKQLAAIAEKLVDIHGQYDQRYLLNPKKHAMMLDQIGGLLPQQQAATAAHQAWRSAETALADFVAQVADHARAQELLDHDIGILNHLAPETGEEAKLASERTLLMNAEQLVKAARDVADLLTADDHDVAAQLARAEGLLAPLAELEVMAAPYQRLVGLSAEFSDFIIEFNALFSEINVDSDRLQLVDDRLFTLRDQARKHGCTVDALPEKHQELIAQRQTFSDAAGHTQLLRQQAADARAAFVAAKDMLTTQRRAAADVLSQQVEQALKGLEMPQTRFEVAFHEVDVDHWQTGGVNELQFMVSTNAGSPPKPLEKVASGGEVSRLMLALKQVLYADLPPATLVFDEVDTGVSGKVAEAMADAMAALAARHQVLAITHLPQVAAKGQAHLHITKQTADGDTITEVTLLDAENRFNEVARMIAGRDLTAEAKAAAKRLLEG